MPQKRKPRLPSRATSTPSGDITEHLAEQVQTPIKQDVARTAIVSDLWTDEQETSLFKGMIRWKPVGSFRTDQSTSIFFTARNIQSSNIDAHLIRHAQAFSDGSNISAPPKSRLYLTTRRSYPNPVYLGETEESLQS